jgi:hypothetical protein
MRRVARINLATEPTDNDDTRPEYDFSGGRAISFSRKAEDARVLG